MKILLLLNFIVSFVLVLAGVILRNNPSTDRFGENGYCTPTSQKSEEHWNYAQKIAPGISIRFSFYLFIVEIILNIILFFISISVEASLIIGESVGATFIFIFFLYTDKKIEKKFTDKPTIDF